MAMNLCYIQSNAAIVEDLLHFGDIGNSKAIYGSWHNRSSYYGFLFTKCKKSLVKIYQIYRGYVRNDYLESPVAEIKKAGFEFGGGIIRWKSPSADGVHYHTTAINGNVDHYYRAFMSLGIVQNIGIRWLRTTELWKFINDDGNIEMGSIRSKDVLFGFNGKLISQIPKECRQLFNNALEVHRLGRNRNARANYANYSTSKKVNEAKETGDYSRLKPQDVFKIRNVATRTHLIEHYGQDMVLDTMEPNIVHKDEIDGRSYELLRFHLPETGWGDQTERTATYLKMINPSTGESCIEGVPNNVQGSSWSIEIDMNTIQDALKWRDGDKGSYDIPQVLT